MAGILESACNCLEIPIAADTVVQEVTVTPAATMTVGLNGIAEATTTETHYAVATHTKFMYLLDTVQHEMVMPKNADPTRSLSEQILGYGRNQSSLLNFAGSRVRNTMQMLS